MSLAELVLHPDTGPLLLVSGLVYGLVLGWLWVNRR